MMFTAMLAVSLLRGVLPTEAGDSTTAPTMRDYMRARNGVPSHPAINAAASVATMMTRFEIIHGMPLFARRLNVACSYCHTTIPRLNLTGYKFRAAGFRMPEDIGTESKKKFELGDYFSARIQSRFDVQVTNQPNGAAVANLVNGRPGPRTTTVAPSFMEATMYPVTGSWGKYFGSLSELSVSPEDFFEVENAYIRIVSGSQNAFFTSRIGIFHPWEGVGASDRPYSNARPLFQSVVQSSSGRSVPYVYQPWGLDEVGIELGGEFEKFSVRGAILGGTFMRWEEEANSFIAFPAQTGPWRGANQAVSALGRPFDYISHNTPDFSANVTYQLHEEGGGVSLIYYHGTIATPTRCTDGTLIGQTNGAGEVCGVTASTAAEPFGAAGNTSFDFTSATAFRNNFDRVALYASYPIGHFLPQAGYQRGRDNASNGSSFNSDGMFLEGAYTVSKIVTAGVRYDTFHPNTTVANKQWAVTPYVNIPLQNGLQVIAEYQHRNFELPPGTFHRANDTFQVRMIFIQ